VDHCLNIPHQILYNTDPHSEYSMIVCDVLLFSGFSYSQVMASKVLYVFRIVLELLLKTIGHFFAINGKHRNSLFQQALIKFVVLHQLEPDKTLNLLMVDLG